MEIFCPICGRSSNEVRFIGEFCEDCVSKKLGTAIADSATIRVCKFCGTIWSGGSFEKENNHSMAVAIAQALKPKGCTVKVVRHSEDVAIVLFTCDVDGHALTFRREMRLDRHYEMCKRCSRLKAGYYEAVVQLRGPAKKVDTLLAALKRFIERRNGFISRVNVIANGCDAYVSDKKAVSEFFSVRKLKPGRSYTLYGMKNGRKLYRNIYVLRMD